MRRILPILVALLFAASGAACDKGESKSESKSQSDNKTDNKTADGKKTDGKTAEGNGASKPGPTKPVATNDKPASGGWHTSKLPQGFSFSTPTIPTKSDDAANGITNYQVKADNHYYMVQTMKMPEFLAGALDDEKALAAGFAKAEENMLATMNAKALKPAERMTVVGMPANELVAGGTQAGQKFEVIARQIVDSKERMLYQMMLLHPGGPAKADNRKRFFDSFQATAK